MFFYDKNNNPIIQRESGSYYIKDPKTGKQQTVKSPNEHGNTSLKQVLCLTLTIIL
jgi:hypothetical protein